MSPHVSKRRALQLTMGLVLALASAATSASELYTELRVYPAGGIASIGASFAQDSKTEFAASVLYNRAERGDAGKHDDESGDGFGIGLGATRFVSGSQVSGWFYGVRAELFQLDIDWRDSGNRRGNTDITVLQPTARAGYRFSQSHVELAGNLGAEINLRTRGEAVGEGAIALAGVAYRF